MKFLLGVLLVLNFHIPFSFSQDTTKYKDPKNIDVSIFRSINNSRTNTLDKIVFVTDKSILPVSILTPAVLFTVSRINKDYYDENSAVLNMLSEATSTIVSFGLKIIVKRPRPYTVLKNVMLRKGDLTFADPYSFPSGHSATAFSFATSLTLRYPDKPVLISGLYAYALAVSLGRIYLGVHYPSDVLSGMLIGTGSAILIFSLRKEIISGKNSLFNEPGQEDKNSSSKFTAFALTTFIAADALNYLIHKINIPVIKKSGFETNNFGNRCNLKFCYNF